MHIVGKKITTKFKRDLLSGITFRSTFVSRTDNMSQIDVFWAVTSCRVVVGYHRFRVKLDAACISKILISYHNTRHLHNPRGNLLNLHRCKNLRFCLDVFTPYYQVSIHLFPRLKLVLKGTSDNPILTGLTV